MKIFAIRDRLLDYYQRPMVFDRAPDLLSALAKAINSTEAHENEIHQAPDQFEVWQIGEVDDQGGLIAKRELVCNCASLIRAGVWQRRTSPAGEAQKSIERGTGAPEATPGGPTNSNSPQAVQNAPQATREAPGATDTRSHGSDRIAN